MNYIAPLVLLIEALMSIFPHGIFKAGSLNLIFFTTFLILAVTVFKKPHNKIIQWIAIIISLIFGAGGFLGYGGIFAIVLAIIFFIQSRKTKTNSISN